MKRIIVTGPCGFIGSQTLPLLIERGFEVYAIDLPGCRRPKCDGVHWREIDLMDHDAVDGVIEEIAPTHLLHFAWFVKHGVFWSAAENLDWVAVSLRMIRSFRHHGGRRAVIAGTCAEYEWSAGAVHCAEDQTPLLPHTIYGTAKNALRSVVEAFSATHDMQWAWGRVFLLYGPGEPAARLVPSLIRSIKRGEQAQCRSANLVRDMMHVSDVADAFVQLADSPVLGPVNIASGSPVNLGDVAKEIAVQLHAEDRLELADSPCSPGNPAALTADTRRLSEEVGFVPQLSLREGLRRTIAAFDSGTAP